MKNTSNSPVSSSRTSTGAVVILRLVGGDHVVAEPGEVVFGFERRHGLRRRRGNGALEGGRALRVASRSHSRERSEVTTTPGTLLQALRCEGAPG